MNKILKRVGVALLGMMLVFMLIPTLSVKAEKLTSGDYTYSVNSDGTVTIEKYNGNASELVIPDTIEGMKVTKLATYSFARCKTLTKVTLPDTLTRIYGNVFQDCENLEYVFIPASVTTVESFVFSRCDKLETAGPVGSGCNIEFGWTSEIPANAFNSCELKKITLPKSIEKIGIYAFANDKKLESVNIPASVTRIYDFVFNHSDKLVTAGPVGSGSNIEYGWTDGIPGQAFSYSEIESIIIPDSIKTIGENAFSGSSLKEITIPGSVDKIAKSTFYNCGNLTKVTIKEGPTKIDSWAFTTCDNLKSVIVPDSVVNIDNFAFSTNNEKLVLYGHKDTVVEQFATDNRIKFVVIGDENGWVNIDGVNYWYEDGIRQGYDPDDASYRGKEIYDPDSDAWYWLDNVQQGAVAKSKDVYQESAAGIWGDIYVNGVAKGKWVRYDENGHMIKGWQTNENGTYYFDPVYGTMAKGKAYIDGKEYYFDVNTGILANQTDDNGNSLTQDGWHLVDGVNYWYEGGVRQGYNPDDASYRGKEICDPATNDWYWLDNVQQGAVAKSKDVYQESLAGEWGDNTNDAGEKIGKWVRYDENGHMIKGWQVTDAGTWYFDLIYGTMAKGEAVIDGQTYNFDVNNGMLLQ